MKKKEQLSLERLKKGIEGPEDPRRPWGNYQHKLVDILVILLLGLICGCDSWEDIEDYAETKKAWLAGFLELPNGIPMSRSKKAVLRDGQKSHKTRYYISNLLAEAPAFQQLIRGHWAIENQLHWVLRTVLSRVS